MKENTWTYEKQVSGFVTITEGREMISLAIADARCGEEGKVIAVFGEAKGIFEDETIRDINRVIDCANYFVGIENIKDWISKNPRITDKPNVSL